MPRIKQLPPEEAQKIAAGEVVERPANVVKELIENALDAGATHITISIEKAGKNLIRVVDNGHGMDRYDAIECFKHHATSKITSVHDLASIATFGFRGEALSSISSVSRVILHTKTADERERTSVYLEGGIITKQEQSGGPTGCDIQIRDLLFNVPVRKKFMKSNDTEWRHIVQLVHAVSLARPDIHIELYHDEKQILNCPKSESLKDRAAQLWDHELARGLIECTHQDRSITLSGIISNHTTYRYDRNHIYFFVNGRWIKNYTLARALIKGYGQSIPAHQYPAACIFITIDPTQIDVNIHPRKEEVLFLHQRTIDQIIETAVRTSLEKHLSAQLQRTVRITATPPTSFTSTPPYATPSVSYTAPSDSFIPYDFNAFAHDFMADEQKTSQVSTSHIVDRDTDSFSPEQQTLDRQQKYIQDIQEHTVITRTHHTILGVYDLTYIMVAHEDGILFIDQHAAHERIIYEQIQANKHQPALITLMFPHVCVLKKERIDALEPHLDILRSAGITVSKTSDTELLITATPIYLKNVSLDALMQEIISHIAATETQSSQELRDLLSQQLHLQMACKAAVKAGDTLSAEQIQELLNDLAQTPHRFTCPHGRPTSWLLPHQDIVKKFHRTYESKKRTDQSDDRL